MQKHDDGERSKSKTLRIAVVDEGRIECEPERKTEVTDKRNEVEMLEEVRPRNTQVNSVVICETSSSGDDALNACRLKGFNDEALCDRGGNAESHSADEAEICNDLSSSSLNKANRQQLDDSAEHSIIPNSKCVLIFVFIFIFHDRSLSGQEL